MKQIHIRLSDEKHKELKILSAQTGKSVIFLVGMALSVFLANKKRLKIEKDDVQEQD